MVNKMDELVNKFKYWNNRGKSAICRYILDELNITLEQFGQYTKDWVERKLVKTADGKDYEVILD